MLMKDKKSKKAPSYYEDDDEAEIACGCCHCTYKCCAIFIGSVLCAEFVILLIELYFIATNDYFDLIYGAFYAFFLISILVAALIFLVWFCDTGDISRRKWLPGALLVAVIGNFILIAWILIYLLAIYDNENEYVIVQRQISYSEK